MEYGDLVQEVRGAYNPGRLKLQSSGGVMFKNIKTGLMDQYQSSDIDKVSWLKRARGNCLKVQLHDGTTHRYDGFKESEYDKLASFLSTNYSKDLQKVDLSVKGWNWGSVAFEGNTMEFSVGPKTAFEVPLANVSHATTAKNEVTLEFHVNDDAAVSLVELRFHIPTDPNTETDAVEDFYNNVINKADVIQATGDAITSFPEIQCLTPRGRYDIKLYPTFLQLHGKTFDYKVPYTTILRLFLLPHKDQMFFVMSLDPPIKQGQTRYHFLILLFAKDDEMTVELALSEEECNEKYDSKLSPEMSGPEFEIVSRIFKAVTKRKITVPGNFMSNQKHHCVGCSYRAATGLLYPLERGFIFVHKPPIHVRFDEIACVNFARSAGSTKSFDFDIETTSGTVHTFNGIEKDEYGRLYDFVTSKKLRLKNVGGKLGGKKGEKHDDMEMSDNEEAPDGYLERMKAEGRKNEGVGDEDSDDSSDESFNPGDSGSEVAEEYDSNPPTTDSSDESDAGSSQGGSDNEEKKKKRQEKREQKEKERERKKKLTKTTSEGKPRKRKKEHKDPNRPKRPQTSYFLWLAETREPIKEDNPGISATDILKKAGEMWKEVTDKSKWEKLAEKAKEEYAEAMVEYNKKPREDAPGDSPSQKSAKKSPKKATQSSAGAGSDFKSKEFISSSDDSARSSDEDKPLKTLKEKVKEVKKDDTKEEEEDESNDEEYEGDKGEEDEKDKKDTKKATRKSRRQNKRGTDSDESSSAGELPDEEEELKTPTASEQSSEGENN